MDIKTADPIEITLSQSQSMDSVIGINEEEVSLVLDFLPHTVAPITRQLPRAAAAASKTMWIRR